MQNLENFAPELEEEETKDEQEQLIATSEKIDEEAEDLEEARKAGKSA